MCQILAIIGTVTYLLLKLRTQVYTYLHNFDFVATISKQQQRMVQQIQLRLPLANIKMPITVPYNILNMFMSIISFKT